VTQTNGTLVVTNSSGTGSLVIGQKWNTTFAVNGGTVIVDSSGAPTRLVEALHHQRNPDHPHGSTFHDDATIGLSARQRADDLEHDGRHERHEAPEYLRSPGSGQLVTLNISGRTPSGATVRTQMRVGYKSGTSGAAGGIGRLTVSNIDLMWTDRMFIAHGSSGNTGSSMRKHALEQQLRQSVGRAGGTTPTVFPTTTCWWTGGSSSKLSQHNVGECNLRRQPRHQQPDGGHRRRAGDHRRDGAQLTSAPVTADRTLSGATAC